MSGDAPAAIGADGTLPSSIETVIAPRPRDIGDSIQVRRVLPYGGGRMVGPFIFFDHLGPLSFAAGVGMDVRPHPHIGLATVTYLFDGAMLHRDSLGTVKTILPGAVNWMMAGRGIVHSERTPPEQRAAPARLYGAQFWVALPQAREEDAPFFAHHPAEALPRHEGEGVRATLVAGSLWGLTSPVATASELVLAELGLAPGARLDIPEQEERALYVLEGAIGVAGRRFEAGRLLVLRPGQVVLSALEPARLLLLGGARLDGPRHIWWNFVSSRPERIEQAKEDWRAGRYPAVSGETEFIPLPA